MPLAPLDKNNWAPRIGFAWSPKFWKSVLGEDATVIRGGFSIAYDAAFYNILLNVRNAAPFSAALKRFCSFADVGYHFASSATEQPQPATSCARRQPLPACCRLVSWIQPT